jgi:tetratricopeptide (TPR) repeat protein
MTFDEIMTNITSELKNDVKEDVKYLMEKMEEYKNHEYSKEILRAIGRIIYEICPDDMKDKLDKIIENSNLGIEKTIEEADFQMYRNNYQKAFKIMENLISNIEKRNLYQDDSKSEYYCFYNLFEEILYKEIFKPSKDVRQIPENFTGAYFIYGVILFELKMYDKSKEILEKAHKYNPVSVKILFELSEIYKMNNEWEEYVNINKKCLEYAYSSKDIARCYRNYGFYFIEQDRYDMATDLFQLSLEYDQDSKVAQSELVYIAQKTGKQLNLSNNNKMIESIKNENIQFGANPLVISIANYLLKASLKKDNIEAWKFFAGILYDLTEDENFKKIIDRLDDIDK